MHIADMPEFKNRKQVLTCRPEDTVYDVVVSMTYKHFGAAAVVKNDELVGIFTERDLLVRVVGQGRDIENTQIADVMSSGIETATTNDSALLCMGRMNHGRFRHMPVVDSDGKLIGMLSQRDFIAFTMRELLEDSSKD
ncbi:MAG: CBS domain-containing protein [Rhodospirillales bacterium]|nr:CBS domain-containing protein [Rhodospirillales bacterium]